LDNVLSGARDYLITMTRQNIFECIWNSSKGNEARILCNSPSRIRVYAARKKIYHQKCAKLEGFIFYPITLKAELFTRLIHESIDCVDQNYKIISVILKT